MPEAGGGAPYLRARLFAAFGQRARPGPERLVRSKTAVGADQLAAVLTQRSVDELGVDDITSVVETNLWLLTGEAFRYYLPAFLDLAVENYGRLSVFASELVGALTQPSGQDVADSAQRLAQLPPEVLREPATAEFLANQQREWFASGVPEAMFHERFDELSPGEAAAVAAWLEAFRDRHGEDFPFGELDAALDRHWAGWRGAGGMPA